MLRVPVHEAVLTYRHLKAMFHVSHCDTNTIRFPGPRPSLRVHDSDVTSPTPSRRIAPHSSIAKLEVCRV